MIYVVLQWIDLLVVMYLFDVVSALVYLVFVVVLVILLWVV